MRISGTRETVESAHARGARHGGLGAQRCRGWLPRVAPREDWKYVLSFAWALGIGLRTVEKVLVWGVPQSAAGAAPSSTGVWADMPVLTGKGGQGRGRQR